MSVAYHFSGEDEDGVLTVFVNYVPTSVHNTDVRYKPLCKALLAGKDAKCIQKLLDQPNSHVQGYLKVQKVTCDEKGNVFYGGKPLHNTIVKRIQRFIKEGLPHKPLVKFLQNLMANPNSRAIEELYKFLEHEHLPVTDCGCFLGYKAVRDNFKDKFKGVWDNSVGKEVSVPRTTEEASVCSSTYFHVGSLTYVNNFTNLSAGDHIVIVRVNPADVVNVPYYDAHKMITCKYKVVAEYKGPLTSALYTENANPVQPKQASQSFQYDWKKAKATTKVNECGRCKVTNSFANKVSDSLQSAYGIKPDGSRFHNVRGPGGQFAKKGR